MLQSCTIRVIGRSQHKAQILLPSRRPGADPRITETVDLDAQDELRAHVSRLRDDFEFAARILGCEPEEITIDVEVFAKVDFGLVEGLPIRADRMIS